MVSGILEETIGGGPTIEITINQDGTFRFADPDGDVWVYEKQ